MKLVVLDARAAHEREFDVLYFHRKGSADEIIGGLIADVLDHPEKYRDVKSWNIDASIDTTSPR